MFHTEKLSLDEILTEISSLALTPQGQKAILNLKPTLDCFWIKNSQSILEEIKGILQETGSIPLNPLTTFNRAYDDLIRHAVLTAAQIGSIGSFLEDVSRLKRFMATKDATAPIVSTYALSMDHLPNLTSRIGETVSGDGVLDSASSTLSKIRKQIRFTEDKIKSKLQSIMQQADQQALLSDGLIAMRDGRYVIPVKAHAKGKFSGRTLDASKSGSTFFIEPEAVKKLSDELSGLRLHEEDEIYRILSVLTEEIAQHQGQLLINKEGFIHYDQLSAKGKYALKTGSVAVTVAYKEPIKLVDARHPQLGKEAVPLNLTIGSDYKGIVITGPNTGGKTVVLKTVGLLTLMGMCGLLIPADPTSTLSVFEHVLADIGDGQSITQNLSTFSSHIVNINGILHTTQVRGNNALVLLDEVGSGTEPNEGAGIAVAILETLHQRGCTILATTHYSQLKAFAQNTPGFINGSMLFDAKTLNPLYQIQVGEAGKSHALLIALKLGMDTALLDRAHRITYNAAFDQEAYQEMANLKDEAQTQQHPELAFPLNTSNSSTPLNPSHPPQPLVEKPLGQTLGPTTNYQSPFKVGDSVYIHFMKASGIVLTPANKKGEHTVEIKGKRFSLSHKRLKPFIDQKELYPEDYNLDIVTKSWNQRKTEHDLSKGKKVVLEIRS